MDPYAPNMLLVSRVAYIAATDATKRAQVRAVIAETDPDEWVEQLTDVVTSP